MMRGGGGSAEDEGSEEKKIGLEMLHDMWNSLSIEVSQASQ